MFKAKKKRLYRIKTVASCRVGKFRYSYIQIRGNWLDWAGFKIGEQVLVTAVRNKITLTRFKEELEKDKKENSPHTNQTHELTSE